MEIKRGKEEKEDTEQDSIDLLRRARMAFVATNDTVETQSSSYVKEEDDNIKQYLQEVLSESELFKHIRLLEKAAQNKEKRILKPINVYESLERSTKIVKKIITEKEIKVSINDNIMEKSQSNNQNFDAHSYSIFADELLDELFINLIANAANYTDSTNVDIKITIDIDERTSNKLKIDIADFAHGIPDELKEKIFERYDKTSSFPSVHSGI